MLDQPQFLRNAKSWPPKPYSLLQLKTDAWVVAAITIGILRGIRWFLLIIFLLAVLGHVFGLYEHPSWRTVVGTPITVVAGYSLASISVSLVFFLLRPLRRWLIGWLLSGYLIAAGIYGGVGLALAVAFDWFGVNLIGFENAAEGWAMLREFPLGIAWIGVPVAAYLWFQGRRERRKHVKSA